MPHPGVGHVEVEGAVRPVEGEQGEAGHDGGQGERQVDDGVDGGLAPEVVPHQHPGDDQSGHRVERRRRRARRREVSLRAATASGWLTARQNACHPPLNAVPTRAASGQDDQQAEVGDGQSGARATRPTRPSGRGERERRGSGQRGRERVGVGRVTSATGGGDTEPLLDLRHDTGLGVKKTCSLWASHPRLSMVNRVFGLGELELGRHVRAAPDGSPARPRSSGRPARAGRPRTPWPRRVRWPWRVTAMGFWIRMVWGGVMMLMGSTLAASRRGRRPRSRGARRLDRTRRSAGAARRWTGWATVFFSSLVR